MVTAGQTFSVAENSANGTAIGTLVATDGDVTPTTFQNWTITGGNSGGGVRHQRRAPAQITVADSGLLDRETVATFTLTVTVSDGVNDLGGAGA